MLTVTLLVSVVGYRCYRRTLIIDTVLSNGYELSYEPPEWVWDVLGEDAYMVLCQFEKIEIYESDPAEISLIVELDSPALVLHNTRLTVEGAKVLARRSALRELSLDYDSFGQAELEFQISESELKELVKSTSIEYLSFHFYDLPKSSFRQITKMQSLEKLDLAGSVIEDPDFRELVTLPNLRALRVEGDLTDQDLWEIGQLPHLKWLSIGTTQFSDEALNEFRKLHSDCQIQSGREFSVYEFWD